MSVRAFLVMLMMATAGCHAELVELLPARPDAGATAACRARGPAAKGRFPYGAALQRTLAFFEVQQLGRLPPERRLPWRADALVSDGADVGRDLGGGWQDGATSWKSTPSIGYAAAMLAWGVDAYGDAMADACQLPFALAQLAGAADYLLRAFPGDGDELYVEVGRNSEEQRHWAAPEVRHLLAPRPTLKVDADGPGPDVAGHVAAGLAATALAFHRRGGGLPPAVLLERADRAFAFGQAHPVVSGDPDRDGRTAKDPSGAIVRDGSNRGDGDDKLLWAAAWLHVAHAAIDPTYDGAYLQHATTLLQRMAASGDHLVHWRHHEISMTNKGAAVLLAIVTGRREFVQIAQDHLDWWTIGYTDVVRTTPGGLSWRAPGKAAAHAATVAFLALVYGDWLTPDVCRTTRPTEPIHRDGTCADTYRELATRNLDYVLGANPAGRSYVIGFGANAVARPRHAAAMGPWSGLRHFEDPALALSRWRHVAWGGLVGGPDAQDGWEEAAVGTQPPAPSHEPTIEYTSPLPGALARLYREFGGAPDELFPPPEPRDAELVALASTSADGKRITLRMSNRSSWPPTARTRLGARYFVRLEPGASLASVRVEPVASGCGPGAVGPALRPWRGDLAYAEIDCSATTLYPGGGHADVEVSFAFVPTGAWDATNDPSFVGLVPDASPAPTDRVPVYDDGVRLVGREP